MRDYKLCALDSVISALVADPLGGDIHFTDEQLAGLGDKTETVISTWSGKRFRLKLEPLEDGSAFDPETGLEMSRESYKEKYSPDEEL
jgi:hypothetical protein